MKYSVHDYAKALDEAIADGGGSGAAKTQQATIAKNFLALVRHNGDEGRLKKIVDEAGRLVRSRAMAQGGVAPGAAREVIVESARTLAKSQEHMLRSFLKPGDAVEYKVDPGLIAGIRITMNDEMQFDGSMKAKLDSLFGQA